MGTPMNSAAWKVWRDTTYDAVCTLFSFEDEPELVRDTYKIIQGLIGNICYGMITILRCFRSISRLSLVNGGKTLPDDVVLDILSRLSARNILKCRMVCTRWMSLTSTPYFLEHMSGSLPILLLHYYVQEGDLRLYSIDVTPDVPCITRFDTKKLQLDCGEPPLFGGTCDGLVLLWSRGESSLHLYICNPFTGRKIVEVAATGFFFCGFWFHPTKREYFFLTACIGRRRLHQYKIFNLRGESTVVGWYDTFPTNDVPININGSLYNLLEHPVPHRGRGCIMIFDTDSEKIEFGPHPHNDHCNHGQDLHVSYTADMCLLEVKGSLGFAHVCSDHGNLHLWILADNASWRWIPRYKLNLTWDPSISPICPLGGIQEGEMLIGCNYRRLFVVNLETRRVRKIDISISYPEVNRFLIATSYASSLVGLSRLASFI